MVKGAGSEFLCLLSPPCPCFPLSPVPPYPSLSSAPLTGGWQGDRKSTRLNSSHSQISYALFCLKKQNSRRDRKPFGVRSLLPPAGKDRLRGQRGTNLVGHTAARVFRHTGGAQVRRAITGGRHTG